MDDERDDRKLPSSVYPTVCRCQPIRTLFFFFYLFRLEATGTTVATGRMMLTPRKRYFALLDLNALDLGNSRYPFLLSLHQLRDNRRCLPPRPLVSLRRSEYFFASPNSVDRRNDAETTSSLRLCSTLSCSVSLSVMMLTLRPAGRLHAAIRSETAGQWDGLRYTIRALRITVRH